MAKQFKCSNYGVCPEADKETIFQETDLEEVDGKYVCPKCGQELEVIEKGGGGKGKLIAIIAGAVVVLGGGAFLLFGGKEDAPKEIAVETVTISPAALTLSETDPYDLAAVILPKDATDKTIVWASSDERIISIDANGHIRAENPGEATVTATAGGVSGTCVITVKPIEIDGEESDLDKEPAPKPAPAPAPTSYNLGWGRYAGPMQGGKPHGLDGEVTVTKSYTIDLKKGGETRTVNPGDKITGCKFKDGKLVSGYIHYKNGSGEKITIGS